MKALITVIHLTLLQIIKSKIFYLSLVLSLFLAVAVILFSDISLGQNIRIIQNFGLAGTFLLAVLISILASANIIGNEQQRGNIYLLKTKPVADLTYITGKFLGLTFGLLIIYLFSFLLVFAGASIFYEINTTQIIAPFVLSFLEIAILIAVAVLFSSFSTALFASILTLAIFFLGHSLDLIRSATTDSGFFLESVGQLVYYTLPNLEKFNLRETISNLPNLPTTYYWWTVIYASAYIIFCLCLSVIASNKREW